MFFIGLPKSVSVLRAKEVSFTIISLKPRFASETVAYPYCMKSPSPTGLTPEAGRIVDVYCISIVNLFSIFTIGVA